MLARIFFRQILAFRQTRVIKTFRLLSNRLTTVIILSLDAGKFEEVSFKIAVRTFIWHLETVYAIVTENIIAKLATVRGLKKLVADNAFFQFVACIFHFLFQPFSFRMR